MKTFFRIFKLAKCAVRASRSPRSAGSKSGLTASMYLSKHCSATLRAEGKLLGGAIDRPAPHTTMRRSACIEASNRSFTSGVKRFPRGFGYLVHKTPSGLIDTEEFYLGFPLLKAPCGR